jgi:hypothetical protein
MDLDKIINIVRTLNEEGVVAGPTNVASGGAIAGLPPDEPPVRKKKKKPPIIARGLMPGARTRWRGGV